MRNDTFSVRSLWVTPTLNQSGRTLVVAIVLILRLLSHTATASDARIATYYWDGGWVEHASWTSAFGDDLTISIDAWNWTDDAPPPGEDPVDYPALNVKFDNVITNDGLLDDFDDGIIDSLWQAYGSIETSVAETGGVLEIDVPEGPSPSNPGLNQVGGVRTKEPALRGYFDVQVDFAVNPDFHASRPGTTNAKLILTDASGHQVEISVRTGAYLSVDLLEDHSSYIVKAETPTSDLNGKLRITRTPATEPVDIDIRPRSCFNTINLKSRGVVPVAILSTIDFAASEVDPATVVFAEAPPTRWALRDVDCDGDMDMILYFRIQALSLDASSTEATLVGVTKSGTDFMGTDSVRIVGYDRACSLFVSWLLDLLLFPGAASEGG